MLFVMGCDRLGQQYAHEALTSAAHRLVNEVGGVHLVLHSWDEGCLGACQVGPVQAGKPRVQLDLPGPPVAQAVTGVQLQQAVHQVLALTRDVLILGPRQIPIQNAAEDLLQDQTWLA